jgi:hypothetical protein
MNLRCLTLLGFAILSASVHAQQPVLYYDFSGVSGGNVPNLGSLATPGTMNGAAAIGIGGPAQGFTGGATGSVLTLDGGDGSFVNSLIGATALGFTTDNYTAGAWVKVTSYGGDSMVFGQRDNIGVDQYLHDGIRDNNPHMGHWGNDTTGSTDLNATFGTNTWYYMTWRYRGDEQSIFLNGQLVARQFHGNLGSNSNVLIGSSNNGGGLPGSLDDVAVYNSSLRANQIEFLAAGGNPKALPAPGISNQGYLGAKGSLVPTAVPKGPSVAGGSGQWAVHEVANNDVNLPNTLFDAVNVLKNPATGSVIADGFTQVINRIDPDSGSSHFFGGDSPFLTNNAGVDDNRRAFLYRALIKVTSEGDYTFGYHGDDGFALRIGDFNWTSFTPGDQNLAELDTDDTRTLAFPVGTGDANVRGVTHLLPGTYPIELVAWEGVGGASHELYYAPGVFTNDADTSTWRLVGDDTGFTGAAGEIRVVPEPTAVVMLLGGFAALIGLGRSRRRV